MYRINSVNSICYKTPGGYQNCLPGVFVASICFIYPRFRNSHRRSYFDIVNFFRGKLTKQTESTYIKILSANCKACL